MNRTRVTLLLTVDLDPVPGEFNTRESWKRQLQHRFQDMVPHYHPVVEVGEEVLSNAALVELHKRLMGLEGYTEFLATAVVENYPNEIALANDFHDLFSFKPMSDNEIAFRDGEVTQV